MKLSEQNLDLETVVTPVKPLVLRTLLDSAGYDRDETNFLVRGFTQGFDLGYQGPQNRRSTSKNLPFNVGTPEILWEKLMKEITFGRVAGPFEEIPFPNYIQSPIGLVPKDQGLQTRLIFHLPFDFDDFKSVNHYIPDELCSVSYNDLDTAVRMCLQIIESGAETVYFAKTDGRSAFRVLPLNKNSWCWLIMKAVNPVTKRICYFVDKCLPFGASISCALFQRFSNALKAIHQHKVGIPNSLTNYLDDFLFLAGLLIQCNWLLNQFLQICDQIGFPILMEKQNLHPLVLYFLGFC